MMLLVSSFGAAGHVTHMLSSMIEEQPSLCIATNCALRQFNDIIYVLNNFVPCKYPSITFPSVVSILWNILKTGIM